MGESYSGSTGVSKTSSGGSIPSSPAQERKNKDTLITEYFYFFLYVKIFLNKKLRKNNYEFCRC